MPVKTVKLYTSGEPCRSKARGQTHSLWLHPFLQDWSHVSEMCMPLSWPCPWHAEASGLLQWQHQIPDPLCPKRTPKCALHFFFFFVFFFAISSAAPVAYGSSQARGQIGAVATGLRQSHSNAGSLTHWARAGIEPANSQFLVGFVNHSTTTGTPALHFWPNYLE